MFTSIKFHTGTMYPTDMENVQCWSGLFLWRADSTAWVLLSVGLTMVISELLWWCVFVYDLLWIEVDTVMFYTCLNVHVPSAGVCPTCTQYTNTNNEMKITEEFKYISTTKLIVMSVLENPINLMLRVHCWFPYKQCHGSMTGQWSRCT